MIIIGERINSSRKPVSRAIEKHDIKFIQEEALRQIAASVDYLEINAGAFWEKETDYLRWLVVTVQEVSDKPLCIDTVNPTAAAIALRAHRGVALLNSISADKKRYASMLPLVKEYGCGVIALCSGSSEIPESIDKRVNLGIELWDSLTHEGIAPNRIFLDPLAFPISVDQGSATKLLTAMHHLKQARPQVQLICGISNVSFGLPCRSLLNRSLTTLAIYQGLDAAILDPCDKELMASIIATKALVGKDEYCLNYLEAYRQGKLKVP